MNTDQNIWQDQEDDFDLRSFVFKYLRYWYWFAISTFICLTAAFLYLRYSTPIYEVSATLLVKDEEKGMSSGMEMMSELDIMGGSKLVENEIEVLRSRALIEKVIDDLNLTVSYWNEGSVRDVELYKSSPIKINATELTGYAFKNPLYIKILDSSRYALLDESKALMGEFLYSDRVDSPYGSIRVFQADTTKNSSKTYNFNNELIKVNFSNRDALVSNMIAGLGTELINQKSTVIKLSSENALPQKGKDIMRKLLDEYAFASLEDKNREATSTLNFIEDRLKLITSELGDVEQDVEQYRRSAGITDLSTEANLFLEKVKDNDTKLNEVNIQLKVMEGVERYLSSNQIGNISPSTLMVSDPVLTSYISQLSNLEMEREKLARSTTASNPFLETVNTQMTNIKQAIKENLRNQKSGLQVTQNSLQALNARLEGAISTIPRKEREYVEIKRQASIKENLYLLLLKKREETALSYASTVTDSRVVDFPYTSNEPIKPKKKIVALLGLLLGLIVPAGIINIKDLLTNTVQSKKEIEDKTGLSVFGEVGRKSKDEEGEVLDVNSRSFISEQVRMIRSNMQYLFAGEKDNECKTVLITSSTGGEGKSFITTNVAASLGLLDKKVIILGLDLRKPKINEYLDVLNHKGISTYLIGKAKEAELIQATMIKNVYIIPSGPIPPNPSELIANGKLDELIAILKPSFDFILIDTPPTTLVTDAELMAPLADACFYLVRHESTPKAYLQHIKTIKAKNVFKSLNIIFNAVNYKNSADYGYGYGYGYGGYYGETKSSGDYITRKWLKIKTNYLK